MAELKTVHYYVARPQAARWYNNWLLLGLGLGIVVSMLSVGFYSSTLNAPHNTLKRLILEGEAGARGYNSYNRGSMRCAKSNNKPLDLTKMTVGEIRRYQSMPSCTTEKLLAVGHYQIVPETLEHAVRTLNIPDSARFTPQLQDKIFALYLAKEKQPAIRRWICTGNGLYQASHAVAGEWAIFKTPYTNRGVYDGKGNNKARISAHRVKKALVRARVQYVMLTQAGTPSNTAYAMALGVNQL